jgi:hypothetical protein
MGVGSSVAVKTVAIIDDDEDVRDLMALQIGDDPGLKPYLLKGQFRSVDQLIEQIGNADYVLCDQRLQHRNYANFHGTDVVVKLYDQRKPAILITQYESPDRELLTRNREKIPFIINRGQQDDVDFKQLFLVCARELAGNPPPERRKHRAIVYIDSIEKASDSIFAEKRVVALVPTWKRDKAITFPLSIVPKPLQRGLAQGSRLIAQVNIGAKEEEDLFLTEFENAPEPLDEHAFKSTPST